MLTQHRIGEPRELINSDQFNGKLQNHTVSRTGCPLMSADDTIISDSIEDTSVLMPLRI